MKQRWRVVRSIAVVLGGVAVLAGVVRIFASPIPRGETRAATDVFGRWVRIQSTRVDVDFAELASTLDPARLALVRRRLPAEFTPPPAWAALFPAEPKEVAPEHRPTPPGGGDAFELLRTIYAALGGPTDALLRLLQDAGLATKEANAHDLKTDVGKKYRGLLRALVSHPSWMKERLALFALGNRFFEYCFRPATYPALRALIDKDETLPLVRLLFEGIAYTLARNGWAHWHASALDGLQARSDAGDEIVYIAGGTDIYRLVQWGLRKVRVIDPMFPSQARFYSEGWEYLIRGKAADGGLGDRIVFKHQNRELVRRAYSEDGTFTTDTLSDGTKKTLTRSVTEWALREKGKEVGSFILERRFLTQADLAVAPGRTHLVSFNELFFLVTQQKSNWGIDPAKLDPSFRLFVKQLRAPVDRATLLNVRDSERSRYPYEWGTSVD